MHKKCLKCGTTRTILEFYKNRTKPDGLQNYCKPCQDFKSGSNLTCTECSIIFTVRHRNVKYRKNSICKACVVTKNNKSRTKEYITSKKGYKFERTDDRYTLQHRRVMQEFLGRKLTKGEVVHHIDGNKTNNHISNLFLTDQTNHSKIHANLEKVAMLLVQKNFLIFDKDTKEYKINDDRIIL